MHDGNRVFAAARGKVGGSPPHAGEPITTMHLFDLGSVSKTITAAAVLRLVELKELRLDAPLSAYFTDLPAKAAGVTARHLLGHTSGLPKAGELSARAQSSCKLAAREILAARSDREPGSEFEYSNAGYQLLAALVEQVSGGTFEAYVQGELFRPAGLRTATLVGGKEPQARAATWRISGARDSAIASFPSGFGRKAPRAC